MSATSPLPGRPVRLPWISAATVAALLLLPTACDPAGAPGTTESEPNPAIQDAAEHDPLPAAMRMTVSQAPAGVATSRLDPADPTPPRAAPSPEPAADSEPAALDDEPPLPSEREPLELRIAKQRLTVRLAPDHRAPVRARIPRGESFEVLELVGGRGCSGKGWADVGNGGFVCLAQSRKSSRAPRMMPPVRHADEVLPFYFARNLESRPARRWSSMASYLAGDEPRLVHQPGRDFAFTSRRREGGQIVLVDERGRVMPEQDLHRFRPSSFEGRDLLADPVPEGQRLAWAVDWPQTTVRVAADPEAEAALALDYHAEILVHPEPVSTASGTWLSLVDGGFVRARDIRRFEPVAPLADEALAQDELWIDVELDQQVLTVMRGTTPIFATLISSGLKGPTPRGLFRINKKQAYGRMSSSPGASDAYTVEAVPYVQYFNDGIALHSAYWHDRFGFKLSHGCINLSPRDAAFVYSLTAPHARGGWMDVYEDEGDLGTRVRVHDGDETVADRRGAVEHVQG